MRTAARRTNEEPTTPTIMTSPGHPDLCSDAGLRGIIDAVVTCHEQDSGSKACCFVIAGSYPAKLFAKKDNSSLFPRMIFNDVDVFYAFDWVPGRRLNKTRDHSEPGFIECFYRDLVVRTSPSPNGEDGGRVEFAVVDRAARENRNGASSVQEERLAEVNFVRRYDVPTDIPLEKFIHSMIDVNAVKAGVKVVVQSDGFVDISFSKNSDFDAFLDEQSDGFGVLCVPDVKEVTHPANSLLRCLIKAHAMDLAFRLPDQEELRELARNGVLARRKLLGYHVAAFERLPADWRAHLTATGLVFVEVGEIQQGTIVAGEVEEDVVQKTWELSVC